MVLLPISSIFPIFLINILQSQQIHILPDGETWSDDYAIDINGVIGWSYPSDVLSPIIIGSHRSYHGYYEEFIILQYAGYFYRKFQCEYKSNISIAYNAYFGCNYDANADKSVVYINANKFESAINANNLKNFNITDSILVNKADLCTSNNGKLLGVTPDIFSNSPYIQVGAYTTFDIGFTMIGMGLQEFAAISDINITCHKINQSDSSSHNASATPAPTITLISDPIDHKACSEVSDPSLCHLAAGCGWDTSCTCASGDAVDIIFAIYSELGNDQSESGAIQNWFTNDVFSNINVQQSRVGIISFDDTVTTELNMAYHSLVQITAAFDNITWKSGYLNFEALFDEVISQFDRIQSTNTNTNTQQILVIITDDNPRIAATHQIPLCPYRTAFASRNIRVIPIVIDHVTNQPDIAEYDCIIQNAFDAMLVPAGLTYANLNNKVTNKLSAALCPNIGGTDRPTLSPSIWPTLRPTLQPTNTGDDGIEVIINITNPIEINVINLIAIVANTTGLDTTQISVTPMGNILIIWIVGTDQELDLAEKRVDDNLEDNIEQETGGNVQITSIKRINSQHKELKQTITYLIITICILTVVILAVLFICCYCFVIKKKTVKLKDGIEFAVDNKLRKRQSVPSTTMDQRPSLRTLHAIHNNNSGEWNDYVLPMMNIQPEPEMLRVVSDGNIQNVIFAMNRTTIRGNTVLDIDDEDEDEEEVNKMYCMKSEELCDRKRQRTITKTGEEDDIDEDEEMYSQPQQVDTPFTPTGTPHYGPQASVAMSEMDKQMSLHTPHMTPINLSLSQQALYDDLLNNLPLPREDDGDVVKDMKNEMANTNPDDIDGEIDVSSDDNNDDNDAVYLQ